MADSGYLVGAGLSVPIGLPGWNAFNQALIEQTPRAATRPAAWSGARALQAYLDQLQGQSLTAVEFVRRRVGSDFHVVVRGALYERKELRKFEPTEVHYALAKLAVESRRRFPACTPPTTTSFWSWRSRRLRGGAPGPIHVGRRSWADGPRVVHLHGYFPFTPPPVAAEGEAGARADPLAISTTAASPTITAPGPTASCSTCSTRARC